VNFLHGTVQIEVLSIVQFSTRNNWYLYCDSGSINNGTYGSGYGSVVINISTSTSSKSQGQGGGDYTPGQTINMNADTTYYLLC
jgi:hypothetical protein